MEHIDAITAVLRAIDAGQRPVHLEQVECAQPIPEWYGTFPEDRGYYHITLRGHEGLVQIAMPQPNTDYAL